MRFNSIISKILLAFVVMTVLFLLGSYLVWKKQKDLLIENSVERRKRAELIFNNTVEALSNQFISYTYDYTYWDETAAFVKNPTKEWAKINLEETMPKYNVSFVWILNPKFEIVYSHNTLNKAKYLKIPLSKEVIRSIITRDKFPHFFLNTEDFLLEFSGAPVQLSSDSTRVGTPYGYLFNARLWDASYLDLIKNQTQSDISLVSPLNFRTTEANYNPIDNPENIFAKIELKDYDEKTVFNLCSVFIDNSILEVKTSYSRYSTIWFASWTFILAILLFLLSTWIFKPITVLSKNLATGESTELIALSKTETVFGNYAKLFLDFLNQKKVLEVEIKKRETAEKELLIKSSAIEQSPASILIVDTNGKAVYVNPKFVETSGYTIEDLADINLFDFLANNSLNKSFKTIAPTIISGKEWEGEILSKRKSGELYWENIRVAPTKGEDGKIVRFVVLKEDITENKKIMNELISAKVQAEESGRAKEAFFTNMSHELRTPLIGILGFAEMIIEEASQKESVDKAKIIHKSGIRLLETLNKVLDLSKAKNPFEKIYLSEIELSSFVQECFTVFEEPARQKNLSCVFSCDNNLEYYVKADSYLLNSILHNLLNNAIKFTNSGKVEIKLYTDGSKVIVDIIDTGIGIPEELIDFVFEEFRQVSEGIGRAFGGTGLGLTIVKKYTELLNGTISVKSKVREGSTFSLALPLIKDPDLRPNSTSNYN